MMADDSRNEHLLMLMAAEEASVPMEFQFVDDGSALLDHLSQTRSATELPDLVVLDLRMPIMDGHSTLLSMKADPALWQVPVVVFTTSTSNTDVQRSLDYGAAFVRVKPSGFIPMMDFVRELHHLCVTDEAPATAEHGVEVVDDDVDIDFRPMRDMTIDLGHGWAA